MRGEKIIKELNNHLWIPVCIVSNNRVANIALDLRGNNSDIVVFSCIIRIYIDWVYNTRITIIVRARSVVPHMGFARIKSRMNRCNCSRTCDAAAPSRRTTCAVTIANFDVRQNVLWREKNVPEYSTTVQYNIIKIIIDRYYKCTYFRGSVYI